VKAFAADNGGATAIEYALIAGLISIMVVTWATNIGSTLNSVFTSVLTGFR
jgi:pilus assembly protein Flp/PilA